MLDSLITSKTRLKLLLKFFLNPENKSYLRSLEAEFAESSNGIRVELNRLEGADMLHSETEGNKKIYRVNTKHPLYNDINNIVRKYLGLDVLMEKVVNGLGGLHSVYLTGRMAQGLDSDVIDLLFVGKINKDYLHNIILKAEVVLKKKVRYLVYKEEDAYQGELENRASLLLWKQ